jgi:hypothetical protein
MIVALGTSVHQPLHHSILTLHAILRAMLYPTQRGFIRSRLFFILIFVRGIHLIRKVL